MQTKEIKIFIASNKELNDDREVIRNAILSLNKEFESLKLSNIEFYDIPSYSNINTNYQSNINELILESDIFILLLHIRYGIFTIEELDFAIKNNKKIFAYFKGTISDELKNPIVLQEYVKTRELFEKLKNNNKIYPVEYDNRDKLINIIEKDLIFYLQNQYESINNYNLKFFTKPPPRPVELFGRDEDYKNLITAISKNNKVLLLNGIAGIGKTELTKKYFWDNCDKFKFIGWIDYLMGFRESLVSQFKDNIANITPEDDYNTRYKKITKFLTNNEDILLIIDNIDNEIEKDSELQLIRTLPKVTILATSRIKLEVIENKIDLDFLNDEACKELFYKYYNIEINDEFINKIIKFANNHTLTIELLAKTAKAINLPLEEFYNKLKNTGLSEVAKEKISTLYHNDPTKRQIFEHLLKAFQLSGLNDNERYILTNISILPSISTNKTYIKEWLGLESYDDINSLVTKGWINEIGFDVKIHPVIQEAIRGQTNPDFEKCKILINSIIKKLYNESGDNPLLKKEYILYAESILGYFERIKEENEDIATLANNLSTIYKDMGDLNQSLDFQLKVVEIFEKIFDKNHPSLATSYNNLSMIYQDMGDLNQSLDFQLKALEIREKIFDKNHPDLAISYSILSLIYQDMGDLNQSLDFQLKALEIEEKILNHSNLAKSYQNLSSIYLDMDKIKDSLDYLKKSIEISINNNKIEKETLNIYELLQKKQKNDIIKPILIYYFAKIKENKRKYNNSIKYYNKISNNETKDTQNVFNLFIDKITIKDFFCIKELEIDNLSDKKEIYFLGENGDGKTILLQAIILSLKYTKDIGIFTDFVNDNPQETTHISTKIKNDNFENVLDFYYTKNIQESKNYLIYDELLKSKMFLTQNVFAYGGNRNKNDSNKKDDKGFLTLFSPEQYLTSPEEWLKSIYIKEKFGGSNVISLEIAKKILIEIIGQDEESKSNIEIDVNHERVIFKERGTIVKFVQLSDGYKIVLIWICDLLQRLATNNPNAKKTTDFQGIVLVDEIELFLHPKWAYKIVRDLRRWFPNIQFIFTTHSPEVVLGSSKDAVFYRLYKEDSYTKIQKPFEDISNYMANVILTSPLFGLKTARPASNENTYALDTNDDYISSKIHKKIDEFIKQKKYYDSIDIDKIIEEELSKIDKQ